MEQHVQILVGIKTVLLSGAFFFCIWGFYRSKLATMQIKVRGLAYLLTRDSKLFEFIRRISIISLSILDLLVLSAQVNRALEGFPAYMNTWTEVSSMAISFLLFLNSFIVWVLYSPKVTDYLTKLFIKDETKQ